VKRPPKLALLATLLLLLAAPAPAAPVGDRPAPAPGRKPPGLDVREIALDNGLRIFVLERTASPTFAALYQFGVGGATDPKGASGIAHLLEHMMFKGTESIGTLDHRKEVPLLRRLDRLWAEHDAELERRDDPFQPADEQRLARLAREIEAVSAEHKRLVVKNEYDELVTRAGGVSLNASTSWDVTSYRVQLPANRLELWFRLESDRLLHPVFREFYSERDVVYEERRLRIENTAFGRASQALRSMLFDAHPYGTPVIGWPRDLGRLQRADALAYFTTYYSPSNCVMVLAGDVAAGEVERLARKYFGRWKRQEVPRLPITAEPEQQGERRRVVEFDAEPHLQLAWRTVPEGHPDQYALDVLSMVLGGLASSRIEQTVVQQERIASSAGASHPTLKHGGFFAVSGVLRGERTAAELEAAFEREIRQIAQHGVTAEELERARTAVEADRVAGLKSNLGQASRIASAVFISGGVGYIDDYARRIEAVTPEEVQRVAGAYLTPSRRNLVEVRRVETADGGERRGAGGVEHQRGAVTGEPRHSAGFRRLLARSRAAPPLALRIPEIGRDVRRVALPSGVTVFIKEDHSAPSVEMVLSWRGGSNTVPVEELAPYELAGRLWDEGGTAELTPQQLEAAKDELGMSLGVSIGDIGCGASFWSLGRNFERAFELALDVLMRPRFDAERLETLQGQYSERMRRRRESPGTGVVTLLDHVIHREHPRLGRVFTRAEIEAVTPEQIRRVWERHVGRDNLSITVVGDFDADAMLAKLDAAFAGWRTAPDAERRWITHEPILRPGAWLVSRDLPQPAIRIYHQLAIDRTAPEADHAALEILNDVLGGSGFQSRLMQRLRSDEGLTYGISSSVLHESRPGVPGRLAIGFQTKKDSVARSIEAAIEELRRVIAEPVGAAEVEEQIDSWRNRFIFRYTNDFQIVNQLMGAELDDRPYDFPSRQLEAVQRVTVEDVLRVARAYLRPQNLTVAIFGAIGDEDRARLERTLGLVELKEQDVFTGGYGE